MFQKKTLCLELHTSRLVALTTAFVITSKAIAPCTLSITLCAHIHIHMTDRDRDRQTGTRVIFSYAHSHAYTHSQCL